MHEFRTRRRVEFSDTDLGGVVHFSRFFIFMETTEDEFLRSLGTSYLTRSENGDTLGWPKVQVSCNYLRSAHYGEDLDIHLRVARKGRRSITYRFRFEHAGREIARGETTSVCCADGPDGFRAVPIPEALAAKIDEAPEPS